MTRHRVYAVGCCAKKLETGAAKVPARELYLSPLFKAASTYAVQEVMNHPGMATWGILSAHYGLVGPDAMVTDYDHTLKDWSSAEREAWALSVWAVATYLAGRAADQAGLELPAHIELVALAGRSYAAPLRAVLHDEGAGMSIVEPMAGMGVGQRLQWLNNQVGKHPDPLRGLTRV